MRLFNQLIKYDEPDKMVSANRIKRRLKEMGYTSKRRAADAYDFGPFVAAANSGKCDVVAAILRILDEVDCPNCGRIVNNGERFCPNCGSKVRD